MMSSKDKKHHGKHDGPDSSASLRPPAPTGKLPEFGPPLVHEEDGESWTISTLDEAIAFAEPRSGSFEHPDGIWRAVLEALHYARNTGLPEEMVNARGMLEVALDAGRENMDDDDGETGRTNQP